MPHSHACTKLSAWQATFLIQTNSGTHVQGGVQNVDWVQPSIVWCVALVGLLLGNAHLLALIEELQILI